MNRILVVDDDRPQLLFLKKMLAGGGYDVSSAVDGCEALAMYKLQQI